MFKWLKDLFARPTREPFSEGLIRKGGTNQCPARNRPEPPKGQNTFLVVDRETDGQRNVILKIPEGWSGQSNLQRRDVELPKPLPKIAQPPKHDLTYCPICGCVVYGELNHPEVDKSPEVAK
jgi:hypothetical protein